MAGILDQFNLTGQAAFITGAGTGLGREMALCLAEAGCDIVGAGRRAEPLEAVGEEVRARGRRYLALPGTDATVSAQVDDAVQRAIAEMGRISILVNNAGDGQYGRGKPLTEITDEEWRLGIDGNLTATFYCSRAIIPHMLEQGGGRIINISSVSGVRAARNHFMYNTAKGGVVQFTKALAMTYARDNIRATSIAPGVFPKDVTPEFRLQRGEVLPSGRTGHLREIGPLAVFLASPASDYLSGETILLDGGVGAAGITPAGIFPRTEASA